MSHFEKSIASYFVNSLWELPLIGVAGWCVSRLLRRAGLQVQHRVWVATLLLAVATPAAHLEQGLASLRIGGTIVLQTVSMDVRPAAIGDLFVPGALHLPPKILGLLAGIYGLALVFGLVKLGLSLYWTVRLKREAEPLALSAENASIWFDCRRQMFLGDVQVRSSRRVAGPATIALGRPLLLLPPGFAEACMEEDFRAAVAHECAHIRRRDFEKNLGYELTSLVIGFHPVVWFLKSQIAQTREMVCDEMAVETFGQQDVRSYARSLLRLSSMMSAPQRFIKSNAIGIFDANILERRIMTMQMEKRTMSRLIKYGAILMGSAGMLSVAAFAGMKSLAVEPQTASIAQAATQSKSTETPSEQVYGVGEGVTPPKVTLAPNPEFPASARGKKGKFSGRCELKLVVDSKGLPHDVQVTRSLSADFDASAVKAVEQYRFKPATKDGQPVAVSLYIDVNFAKF